MSLPSSLVDFCTMGSFVKKAYLDLCFEENSGREITLHSIKFTISAFVRYFFKDVSGKRPSLAAIVSIKAFNASHLPLMKRFFPKGR